MLSKRKKELTKQFGRTVRRTRKAKGWSQSRCAKAMGISNSHLCHIEKGNYVERDPQYVGVSKKVKEKLKRFCEG